MSFELSGLVETRKRTDRYGLGDHYFRLSMQKLCELKGLAAVADVYAAWVCQQLSILVPSKPVAKDWSLCSTDVAASRPCVPLSEEELRRRPWA